MPTHRLCEPSLSVVQIEERPPLGVQSRGIAVPGNQTRLEGCLHTHLDEEGFEALHVGACSQLDGEGDPNSDHSFPSISHHHQLH